MATSACSSSSAQQPQAQPTAPPTPPFQPNQRYPDPAIEILDPSFTKYRLFSSTLERVATGMRWAEGPVYFPDGGYLLCSDTPNNRIMKFDEKDGSFTVFRHPSNYSNGNTRDRQGRLVRVSTPRRGASPAPRTTATSRCWPTVSRASGSMRPTTSW
ncbi:SMP-30/gluconolactonase/LRE family protein [Mycolicibacterium goodii]|uniref:SMP-30/gluconolactonase/LRE family protein n=1 Tax=Mycolicibacterium goodii TaxID=134601 RepID=UPI00296EF5DD